MPIYLNYIMFFISISPIGLIGIISFLQPINTYILDKQERRAERSLDERMFSLGIFYKSLISIPAYTNEGKE